MKKMYLNPDISVKHIIPHASVLEGSLNEYGIINPKPGNQNDFEAKDEIDSEELYGW